LLPTISASIEAASRISEWIDNCRRAYRTVDASINADVLTIIAMTVSFALSERLASRRISLTSVSGKSAPI
jgi:hypothetical protein